MGECESVRTRFPDLLAGSVDAAVREPVLVHVETCAQCSEEWTSYRETWKILGEIPDLALPGRVRAGFAEALAREFPEAKVIPFRQRVPIRRLAQAAGILAMVGSSFFAGRMLAPEKTPPPALALSQQPTLLDVRPLSLVESLEIPASSLSPDIVGHPDIRNVIVVPSEDGDQVDVSFDITSAMTIKGRPEDKSLVQLLSYVVQNQKNPTYSRSKVIQWVKDTYTEDRSVDPEIVRALANVLVNDTHEGVRLKAIDALRSLPGELNLEARKALVSALRNDPNPAVRMKSIDALAHAAAQGTEVDNEMLETLRQKAAQNDENTYVRVKAAETLSRIDTSKPQ